MKYLDAATLADARNALGFGVPIAKIASHLNVTAEELREALGMPALRPIPEDDQNPVDIFRDVPESLL